MTRVPDPQRSADAFEDIVGVWAPRCDGLPTWADLAAARCRRRAQKRVVKIAACLQVPLAVFLGYNVLVRTAPDGTCWRFDSWGCWGLSLEFISRATGVGLPEGTSVQASSTSAWLSWSLSVTVVLPAGEELPPQRGAEQARITPAGRAGGRRVYRIFSVEDGAGPWPAP